MNEDWGKLKAVYDFVHNKLDDPFADVEIFTDKYKIFFASKNEKMRLSVIKEKSTFLDEVRIANMTGVEINNITAGSISVYEPKPSIYEESKPISLIPSQLLLSSIKGEGKNYFADEIVIFFIEKHYSGNYDFSRGYITISLDSELSKNIYGKTLIPSRQTSIYMNVRVEKI